jgi:hypothetical protein
MGSDELSISFHKDGDKYLTWTINIRGVDFQNVVLPYVISGPKESAMSDPTFWCNITDSDPKNSIYGKGLAGTTSLYWNVKLTITSIEGTLVRGTFEGEGVNGEDPVIFTDGEFMAILE